MTAQMAELRKWLADKMSHQSLDIECPGLRELLSSEGEMYRTSVTMCSCPPCTQMLRKLIANVAHLTIAALKHRAEFIEAGERLEEIGEI